MNMCIEMCKKISEYGLSLLKNGDGILTHCNAGALATSEYGTGLGPLLLGKEKGVKLLDSLSSNNDYSAIFIDNENNITFYPQTESLP